MLVKLLIESGNYIWLTPLYMFPSRVSWLGFEEEEIMLRVLLICVLFFSQSAHAWYFSAPEKMHFTNHCLWVNENQDPLDKVLREFTSSHCETNGAEISGVSFYRQGKQECIKTTGKKVILTVSNRGKESYKVEKPIHACFDKS